MNLTKEQLVEEVKTLQKASSLHAKYSIEQYKRVIKSLNDIEREKELLEQKVKDRTSHLETEINEKQKIANRLVKIAKYDTLTKLPNRYMFKEELDLVLKEAQLLENKFSLMFLDLDGFKDINDSYGHECGDKLLKTVAKRLKNCVRKNIDVVSRLGGDEFTIIFKGLENINRLEHIASNIIQDVANEVVIDMKTKVFVSVSIGIYIYDGNTDLDSVISKADIAMYEAKSKGKNTFVLFNDEMQKKVREKVTLSLELKEAYKNGEFVSFLQPIIDSVNQKVLGAEVLLRWKRMGELVSPAKFIHILENDKLITKVTLWQIETMLNFFLSTNQEFFLSFNLSAKMINNDEIIKFLRFIQLRHDFDASKIHFEITETTLAQDDNMALEIINKIKDMGFKISLDDFGTGYSSLSYIRQFPIDILKIDKTFIDGILESSKDRTLLNAILHMAKILELKTVLEGIETKEQYEIIEHNNDTRLQGYHFHKPMPLEEFNKLI